MYLIRATGLPRPYLQVYREVRTDNSHSQYWEFTGLKLTARHFGSKQDAAVVKAKLVNLFLCTGRVELARRLEIVEALPAVELAASRSAAAAVGEGSSSSSFAAAPETERQTNGGGWLGKWGRFACGLAGCVLTLAAVSGCAAPKVAAEAAYRGEARAAGSGELVASIRAEWN